MLHGTDLCDPASATPTNEAALAGDCLAAGRSAAALVESKLAELGPPLSGNGRFEVGYTLQVPLLKLLAREGGGWTVDQRAIDRLALTISETQRPVVLYLFSTHFGIGAPIEEELLRDERNLARSPNGPLPKDRFHSIDIYPWSFARADNAITRYRHLVIDRVLQSVCRLPPADLAKIRAVTVLGELHHFHADFERGMGVGGPYVVSDYGAESVDGFRRFLQERFGTIEALNAHLGEHFASFAEVDPPAHDIRVQPLRRFSEHIDSFAHGRLPLIGWAFDENGRGAAPPWIVVYLDGRRIARVPARLGRQDVIQARPDFGTADVGWRHDIDFTRLERGVHRLDFFAERSGGALVHLGMRRVALMGRSQAEAPPVPLAEPLPASAEGAGLLAHIDHPPDLASFFHNPLATLWHEFRGRQVVRYLAAFEQQVRGSCLRNVDVYTHQITPFTNPSWDTTKFAVDESLNDPGTLKLGVSLYGEPTYGGSFLDWLESSRHRSYGITEFHPMRDLSADEAREMFDRHRRHGARFLSFFLDIRPPGVRDEAARNVFAIDPDNRDFWSDRLFATFRRLVNE